LFFIYSICYLLFQINHTISVRVSLIQIVGTLCYICKGWSSNHKFSIHFKRWIYNH